MARPKARKNDRKAVACPVEATLEAIGGRWKVLVIGHLLDGPRRFGVLARALRGISVRTLTRQLRELEASGVVRREAPPDDPAAVAYALTPGGERLRPVLRAMHDWGEAHGAVEGPISPRPVG